MTLQRIASTTATQAVFGRSRTRSLEAQAAATLPAGALMQRAGDAAARLALALAPHARRVWIAAGPGNNGGDGLEAARLLRGTGRDVGVLLVGAADALPADAAAALGRAREAGVAIDVPAGRLATGDLALDALLGIGGARAPEGALAEAIRQLNAATCPVLAIDVPSGLDADTGQPFGAECVEARHTLSLLTLKPGLFTGAGRDHAGSVWFDDLGVDSEAESPDAWLAGSAASPARPLRRHAAHKGSFGDIAVVGGAPGMLGAALLAARAAHAAGSGRVYVALLGGPGLPEHDAVRPELMFRPQWCDAPAAVLGATTVVCGCGGGDAVRAVLPRLISVVGRLLLDADALNAVGSDSSLQATLRSRGARSQQTILTPHPLEAARLLGTSTSAVQADRLGAAQALADRYGAVVVLKGSGSIIAAPDRVPVICATGNASLASAGTGDVLAGWIGGIWAQSSAADGTAFHAAWRGVVEHGAAAEPAQPGPLRAADLIDVLYQRLRRPADLPR